MVMMGDITLHQLCATSLHEPCVRSNRYNVAAAETAQSLNGSTIAEHQCAEIASRGVAPSGVRTVGAVYRCFSKPFVLFARIDRSSCASLERLLLTSGTNEPSDTLADSAAALVSAAVIDYVQ